MNHATSWAAHGPLHADEQLRYARTILLMESAALARVADRLDDSLCRAVEILFHCRGSVMVTGMGKAGSIGQKIAATLASTGTRSHFLHPAEAVHGDLGRVHPDDAVLILSQSGGTEEVVRLLPALGELGVPIIAVTASRSSKVGQAATVVIELGHLEEACALGLAPSTSTTAMLAIGDALALVTSRARDFSREDFARFHPAGALGRQLSKVDDHLRELTNCRVAKESQTVREVLVEARLPGRRSGAMMIVDADGKLSGVFTDSDLARLFEARRDAALDEPVGNVMTRRPTTVPLGSMMTNAIAMMKERKISELPVVDGDGRPQGLLDITDVISLDAEPAATPASSRVGGPGYPLGAPKSPLFTHSREHDRSTEAA